MTYLERPMGERISIFRQSVACSLGTPDLKIRLTNRGYPETVLIEAKKMGDRAADLFALQVKEYGEQYAATEIYSKAGETLRTEILDFRTIARVAFKNDRDTQKALLLNEELVRNFDGFRTQVDIILKNAMRSQTVSTITAKYGYTVGHFEEMLAQLNELPEMKQDRDNQQIEAQEATRARDAVIAKMDDWYVDFMAIAPIAVKDRPELLELLNVTVPS